MCLLTQPSPSSCCVPDTSAWCPPGGNQGVGMETSPCGVLEELLTPACVSPGAGVGFWAVLANLTDAVVGEESCGHSFLVMCDQRAAGCPAASRKGLPDFEPSLTSLGPAPEMVLPGSCWLQGC